MNRQRSLVLLVVSLGLLFLAVPRLTRAMPPPGGIKFCLFTGVCEPGHIPLPEESKVQKIVAFFNNADAVDGNCSQLSAIGPNSNPADLVGAIPTTVGSGGRVGLSVLVWLRPGKSLQAASNNNEGVNLWLQYPTMASGGASFTPDNGTYHCSKINGASQTFPFADAQKPEDTNILGQAIRSQQATEDGSGTPDIILSLVFNNVMPNLQQETLFNTEGALYFRENWGELYTNLGIGPTSITVKPQVQSVKIGSGDVGINNDTINDNRVRFTNGNGQTVITKTKLVPCSWESDALRNQYGCPTDTNTIGLYLSDPSITSTVNLVNAKLELKKTLSKLAQESADIYPTNNANDNSNDISQRIHDFLADDYNIWLHPRGEVLIIGGNLHDLTVKSPDDNNFEVKGQKLLVFSSSNSGFQVNWKNYAVYSGSNSLGQNKLASISLSGSQILEGNPNSSDSQPHFDGAYIATSLSGRTDDRITIGGTGQDYPDVTINGLLMADQIAVTRQVNPANSTIATINYDPSFQNGGLLGLSPFIRPLVSEGGSQ